MMDPFLFAVIDALVRFLTDTAKGVVKKDVEKLVGKLRDDAAFKDAIDGAIDAAWDDLRKKYENPELAQRLYDQRGAIDTKSVRDAVQVAISQPALLESKQFEVIARSFAEVLPTEADRTGVDAAVRFFLGRVAERVWHLPALQPIYEMQFQRLSAERAAAMVSELRGLRADLQQGMLALVQGLGEQQRLLTAAALPPPPRVFHNLPNPDYVRFVGRDAELARLHKLLAPESRAWVVVIDGIGGIGKSALALETAYRYLNDFDQLPEEERFLAIIWTSAKVEMLTADGIIARQQVARKLEDIYRDIADVLQREEITRARPGDDQDKLVNRALARQRALLIVDNLETIDDERVAAFLQELPAPTKCIVTTRQRIDAAFPIRLAAMPPEDASALIAQECEERGVELSPENVDLLYRRTGGVPLAIVWSIAQMGYGYGAEAVLRRLGDAGDNNIATYCFEGALQRIRSKPSYQLLLAISCFAVDASRDALGYVADLSEADRDDGLVELERLSLVNRRAGRFSLLPLTKGFVLVKRARDPENGARLSRRWIDYLKRLCHGADSEYYWRYQSYAFYDEGDNILAAVRWCFDHGTADDVFVLLYAAYDYLEITGRWGEIVELCERALNLARSISHSRAQARIANILAWIYLQRGEYQESERLAEEALAQYRIIDSREGESVILQHLGSVYRKAGDFARAKDLYDQAWQIANELGIGDLKALINTSYGKLARDRGDWGRAWEYFATVRDWFERRTEKTPRDEPLARGTWGHLAIVALRLGRPQEARELCLRSLEFFEEHGTKGYLATLKHRLALTEEALGERGAALQHAKEALDWFDRLGMRPDVEEATRLVQRLETQNKSHSEVS